MTFFRPSEKPLAVAVVSGGLDSVTAAAVAVYRGYRLHVLSINYGQRHGRELEYAEACAARLEAPWSLVTLDGLGTLLTGSALTDPLVPVPHGHYQEASMSATVVPNRNAILLSVGYAVAVAKGATAVVTGLHTGDHAVYPDCRPEFVSAFDAMESAATQGFARPGLRIMAPFLYCSKAEIVRRGADLGVPFAETWSCYTGGTIHCGRCSTCFERREAFHLAGVDDPTAYLDTPHYPAPLVAG